MLELFSKEWYLLRSDEGKYRCLGNTEHNEHNLFNLSYQVNCAESITIG